MQLKAKSKRRIMNRLFMEVVKKPYILLLSILVGILSLSLVASITYQGVYVQINDAVLRYSKENDYEIVAKIDRDYIENLAELQSVLWYTSENDVRYRATIKEMIVLVKGSKEDEMVTLIIKPREEDIEKMLFNHSQLLNEIVLVEVMVDKSNLLRFFKGNKEND